jgi:hypothetical protein
MEVAVAAEGLLKGLTDDALILLFFLLEVPNKEEKF